MQTHSNLRDDLNRDDKFLVVALFDIRRRIPGRKHLRVLVRGPTNNDPVGVVAGAQARRADLIFEQCLLLSIGRLKDGLCRWITGRAGKIGQSAQAGVHRKSTCANQQRDKTKPDCSPVSTGPSDRSLVTGLWFE